MIRYAAQTLKAIDEAIAEDGGNRFRGLLKKYIVRMDDAYRESESPLRAHLGVSGIGRECQRELWYNFRWAALPTFEARVLRLFNRGHLEEARFLAMLEMIGVRVWSGPEEGGQFKVLGYKGHFGSALDGIALGVPDLPDVPLLLEFKTSGDKPFRKMVSEGVQSAKWEHYVQMQVCIQAYSLHGALYMVVNKNDDDLYAELIMPDPAVADRYNERARHIIDGPGIPRKVNTSPSWFQCKMCNYKNVCHYSEAPLKNCRTCVHSQVEDKASWSCRKKGTPLSVDFQRKGCNEYQFNDTFHFPV